MAQIINVLIIFKFTFFSATKKSNKKSHHGGKIQPGLLSLEYPCKSYPAEFHTLRGQALTQG